MSSSTWPGRGLPATSTDRRFREQVPGLIERLQRRTTHLTSQVSEVVKELCGRAASRLTRFLATPLSSRVAPKATVPRHPRRRYRLLLSHPEHLWIKDTDLLGLLIAACPEMTALARLTGEFATLLTPAQGDNEEITSCAQ